MSQSNRATAWAGGCLLCVLLSSGCEELAGLAERKPIRELQCKPGGPAKLDLPEPSVGVLALIDALEGRRFGELEEAFGELAATARQDPRYETDLALAVDVVLGAGEPTRGKAIEAWARERPDSAWAHAARAHHYESVGFRARGTRLSSDTPDEAFQAMENWHERAVEAADRAAALDPTSVEPYLVRMAVARAGLGAFDLPQLEVRLEGLHLELVRPQITLCRGAAEAALAVAPWSYRVHAALLGCLDPRWGGSEDESFDAVLASQEHAGANPKVKAFLGYPAYRGAEAAHRTGDLPRALDRIHCALAEGEYAAFYDTRASIYVSLHRFDEALEDRTRAVELYPYSVAYLAAQARDLARVGEAEKAVEQAELAARLEPTSPRLENVTEAKLWDLAVETASWEVTQDRTDVALEKLSRLAARRPELAAVHYRLGYAHWDNMDRARAEQSLVEAVRLDPTHFEAIKLLDRLLIWDRQFERILAYWDRYLELVPGDASGLFERSATYHHLGRGAEALRDVEAACKKGSQEACSMAPRARKLYGR